ncbi:hypothetical protein SAMN04487770_1635 [Butyrivibrio sp. ob235]|nr:hypothetical protein SAMN04487770_1635 [Butyrivibrio sp. ob235]
MIEVKELRHLLKDYEKTCNKSHIRPTKADLADFIGVSVQTIRNGIRGMYNGVYYGLKPCCTRVFSNGCFDILRDYFGEDDS